MLAEYTLELKPETLGGTLGRPIFIVALPFVAAIAKLIENILHEQELRFRGGGFPRNLRPPIDAADLDDAMDGIYAHQRLPPRHLAARLVDDGEKQRIVAFGRFFQPRLEFFARCRRKLEQPGKAPVRILHRGSGKQFVTMLPGVQRFQPHIAAFKHFAFRLWTRRPVLQISHANSPIRPDRSIKEAGRKPDYCFRVIFPEWPHDQPKRPSPAPPLRYRRAMPVRRPSVASAAQPDDAPGSRARHRRWDRHPS